MMEENAYKIQIDIINVVDIEVVERDTFNQD